MNGVQLRIGDRRSILPRVLDPHYRDLGESQRLSLPQSDTSPILLHATFWRPWMQRSSRKSLPQSLPYAKGLCENRQAGQKPVDYNHPVRLFWPRSKPLDLMYVEAEDLLKNFPVQATLSFYDSESDTDNDEENPEEEHDSGFESD
ncbi:protein ripply2.2-like isoform X2 [Hyla sarda]|uniref:protein ripply2.2-like isoform X2 n=1 Tax=Hyla sarda TaxID=327740 RepID=UPI0024C34113|nr:protein ripply2.2-like isoform X2 [Hyla sarda]